MKILKTLNIKVKKEKNKNKTLPNEKTKKLNSKKITIKQKRTKESIRKLRQKFRIYNKQQTKILRHKHN